MMMHKKILSGALVVGFFLVVLVGRGSAQPPPMPSSFYGTVKSNGSNVPLSSKVSAWINGVKYAETPVIEFNSNTVYKLDVPGDVAGTPEIEGGKPGDLIVFQINNTVANQTSTWQSGTNSELNLSIIEPSGSFKIFLPIIFRNFIN